MTRGKGHSKSDSAMTERKRRTRSYNSAGQTYEETVASLVKWLGEAMDLEGAIRYFGPHPTGTINVLNASPPYLSGTRVDVRIVVGWTVEKILEEASE